MLFLYSNPSVSLSLFDASLSVWMSGSCWKDNLLHVLLTITMIKWYSINSGHHRSTQLHLVIIFTIIINSPVWIHLHVQAFFLTCISGFCLEIERQHSTWIAPGWNPIVFVVSPTDKVVHFLFPKEHFHRVPQHIDSFMLEYRGYW